MKQVFGLLTIVLLIPVTAMIVVLAANGVNRPNMLNVRRMASVGPVVVVIRCDKEHTRYGSMEYLVTAEPVAGGERVTALVNSYYSQIPQPGERWKVDTAGWHILFTERVQ